MSQGDLKIIQEALKEVIIRHKELKFFAPDSLEVSHLRYLDLIKRMVNRLEVDAAKIARIGELLEAINEALDKPLSE